MPWAVGVVEMKIPERLLRIASYVPQSSLVADIGTDHALLPVYLARQGICSKIIATDLHAGPLEAASSNVGLFNLWKQVDLRQGDGLEIIQPGEVNVIIIAGMGGVKINEILSRAGAVLQQADRLVLQPSAGAGQVRRWLLGNGWDLVDEDLVIDDERFYEIIVAERPGTEEKRLREAGPDTYGDIHRGHSPEGCVPIPPGGVHPHSANDDSGDLLLEIGPRLLEKKHHLLAAYLDKQIRDMESVLIALRRAQTPAARQRKQEWIRKIDFYKTIIDELNLRSDPETDGPFEIWRPFQRSDARGQRSE
jgi:tRNA (adenine22-N1)-methyltransferase